MTNILTLRRTTQDDLAEVDALLARSYPALLKGDYPPSILVTAIPIISRAQPALVSSGRYFAVCDSAGRIVGAGGMTIAAPPGHRRTSGVGHVRHVVTDHRCIRQGIGRALVDHLIDVARNDGLRRLDCLSTRTAVPFYRACGFTEVATVDVQLRPGIDFPSVLMQRSVKR